MDAIISPDGLYRYRLSRNWAVGEELAFIMLNPSTADAQLDDPTIRRCIGFAKNSGFGGIVVGNLFAWRATRPAELKRAVDPVGPENDSALLDIITSASLTVCAWGGLGSLNGRGQCVLEMIRDAGKVPHCLAMTRTGQPAHPLYLSGTYRPIPMSE